MKNTFSIFALIFIFSACPNGANSQTETTPRVHRYVDSSRPVQEIQTEYPYDISVVNADADTLLSHDVFAKNGKPTVLLFWLTTCAPCRYEMKAISKKYDEWKKEKDFNLYAISIDFPRNYGRFQKVVAESNWPFPAYYDVAREFRKIMPGNLNGLPQVFLLNENGEIVLHKKKYRPGDEDKLFLEIKGLSN